jgi:hypothetical protein
MSSEQGEVRCGHKLVEEVKVKVKVKLNLKWQKCLSVEVTRCHPRWSAIQ